MTVRRLLNGAALCVLLAACGRSEPPREPAASESGASNAAREAAAPRAERGPSVFDPLVGTIDRANGVQSTVDEQAAQQRRRIEDAER